MLDTETTNNKFYRDFYSNVRKSVSATVLALELPARPRIHISDTGSEEQFELAISWLYSKP